MAPQDRRPDAPRIIFVTGFQRSGTTVLVDAVTAASGGATLTTGHLADAMPGGAGRLLGRLLAADEPVDRGVDGRLVGPDLPEEYGWYLRSRPRSGVRPRSFRFHHEQAGSLRELSRAVLTAEHPAAAVVVLKNPWDTGAEAQLLACFPEACLVVVRRGVAGIEASMRRSVPRYVHSDSYFRALMGNGPLARATLAVLRVTPVRVAMVTVARWRLRAAALRLARSVQRLPAERVALLSYDELCADPVEGARWAAHVLDPARLAEAFAASVHRSPHVTPGGGHLVQAVDRVWARAWEQARGPRPATADPW